MQQLAKNQQKVDLKSKLQYLLLLAHDMVEGI